jgi:hypothetical protein
MNLKRAHDCALYCQSIEFQPTGPSVFGSGAGAGAGIGAVEAGAAGGVVVVVPPDPRMLTSFFNISNQNGEP